MSDDYVPVQLQVFGLPAEHWAYLSKLPMKELKAIGEAVQEHLEREEYERLKKKYGGGDD